LAEALEGGVYVINGKTDIVEAQMKKPIMWTILVLAGLVFLAPTSASAKKEADKYEKWLKEEVALLVLP
jgi:hypothetical protein